MSNLPQSPLPAIGPPDLPRYMISLARQIIRDCHSPGHYIVLLDIPPSSNQPQMATIIRQETIRVVDFKNIKMEAK